MSRLVYVILLGIITAGIVHLAILLRLHDFPGHGSWDRLSEAARLFQTIRLDSPLAAARSANPTATNEASRPPSTSNPFIEETACRFTLFDNALHIRGDGRVPFWSLSIYDDRGINIYSITDRATVDAKLDFVIVTADQHQRLKEFTPELLATAVPIESETSAGFVLLRTFRPDSSWAGIDNAFHASFACDPVDISPAAADEGVEQEDGS